MKDEEEKQSLLSILAACRLIINVFSQICTNFLLLFFYSARGRGYKKNWGNKKVYSVQGVGGRATAGGPIFFFNSVQGVGGGAAVGGIGGAPYKKMG